MAIFKKVKRFIFTYDWEIVEVQGALFKLTWGIWLLLPFKVFRTVPGYNAFGSENLWGWGLAALGFVHLIAILSGNLYWRRRLTLTAFFFWIFIIVLLALQSATAAFLPTFVIIAFFMGMNYIRMRFEEKIQQHLIDERKINLGPPAGMAERRHP